MKSAFGIIEGIVVGIAIMAMGSSAKAIVDVNVLQSVQERIEARLERIENKIDRIIETRRD